MSHNEMCLSRVNQVEAPLNQIVVGHVSVMSPMICIAVRTGLSGSVRRARRRQRRPQLLPLLERHPALTPITLPEHLHK